MVQVAGQVPAPDATCKDVHDHRQVDELRQQAHIGDVRHPDLIGPYHGQVLNQVGIPGVGVPAIRGALLLGLDPALQPHFSHQTTYSLVVAHPLLVSPDLSGHPAIA